MCIFVFKLLCAFELSNFLDIDGLRCSWFKDKVKYVKDIYISDLIPFRSVSF